MNYSDLLSTVGDVHTAALGGAFKAVNQLHVLRNWTVGCLIVEFEQNGEDRATYGEGVLKKLCADLAARGMTGLGLSTLKGCRTFNRLYPQIGQSAIGQFQALLPMLQKGQSPIGLSFLPATEAPHQSASPEEKTTPTPLPAGAKTEAEWLVGGAACQSRLISILTGLGKTAAVVLAWLWNRRQPNSTWPRRLVSAYQC